ncbi:TSUP family transporter [Flavobacterium sp. 28YEA47A]|uniref:TSUP family transporter n=1 Tax=Flavobacterium sp. 28YEA47A TaxID=3156276 RepID=UPI003518CE81
MDWFQVLPVPMEAFKSFLFCSIFPVACEKAIGNSIFIIAINSLIGFTGDIGNIDIDSSILFIFSFISILGIFAGIYLNKFINEKNLKKGFGWFVLAMSIVIPAKELLL